MSEDPPYQTASGRISRSGRRRRRRERLAGAVLALLGVAVLIVAVVALRSPHHQRVEAGTHLPGTAHTSPVKQTPATSPATTRRTSSSAPTTGAPAVSKLPLVVLNNTTVKGLAERASERFESGGWTVTRYDNYQNDILSTCAYYDPSVAGAEASARALQAQYPTIKRVKAQFEQLASYDSPIVVILTPDYSAD